MRIARAIDGSGRIIDVIDRGDGRWVEAEGAAPSDLRPTGRVADIRGFAAPVVPPNVIAIGLNYREHARESGSPPPPAPVVFLKATSSVVGDRSPMTLPREAPDEVDYEAELAVVIGRRAKDVAPERALEHVLGYTCGNDVSARDCQRRIDRQWARAKSFDTFCPLGPWIETTLDPSDLAIRLLLNDEPMQESSTSDLIFDVPFLVSYLSRQMTLLSGTVILTGTPSGVGFARTPPRFLRAGDEVAVEVEGIGRLTNPVEGA